MKYLILLGDGMADHPVAALNGLTPIEYANTPAFDHLAKMGRSGMLITVPAGYEPGSEVANTAILGYNLDEVYEGRGPLEAASIGYEMEPEDLAMRCNLISLQDGKILNHHGGHTTTEEGRELIEQINSELGSQYVKFLPGIQYRHLLIIKGGSKYITCAPPHDHPLELWQPLLVRPMLNAFQEEGRLSPAETANLINQMILKSQEILARHPLCEGKRKQGKISPNSIWPWSPGYRPRMKSLSQMYPEICSGAVISAVDLIKGIGHYAGLDIIDVEGATGQADTNYEGKAQAAINALRTYDFVFLHVEATDEAGHDGDVELKIKAIEYLDDRLLRPILDNIESIGEPVSIALLPDHPTPVNIRTHVSEPVPVTIFTPGIVPDAVDVYSEKACAAGSLGLMTPKQFMKTLLNE